MAALSGKNGKVRIAAGVTLKVTEWAATVKSQKLDQTNSESGGFGEYLGGILDGDVNLHGNYEVASAPMALLPPGDVVPITLYLSGTAGSAFTGSLFVESFGYTNPTRGLVTITISGSTTGLFTATSM